MFIMSNMLCLYVKLLPVGLINIKSLCECSFSSSSDKSLCLSLQLHSEVEKPLLTFRGDNFKKDLKKFDHHIADLRKQLASRFAGVEKVAPPPPLCVPDGSSYAPSRLTLL